MDIRRLLEIARPLLAQPTAPFHEDAVRGEILQQLAQCPHVTAEIDTFGNIVAAYQHGNRAPLYALAAHMDHPGWVLKAGGTPESAVEGDSLSQSRRADSGSSASAAFAPDDWEFLGGVPQSYLEKEQPTRDFGAFAMWDLPACDVHEGRIFSRACDDLIGCAAIIATFQELEVSGSAAACLGLFTRAEEVGFIGAIHLAKSGRVPREMTIVSLETSSEKSGLAKMGEGVVVRVGDKSSVFDSAATAELVELARAGKIRFQRSLMSGGTCEATAYQLYGYRCGALCVALGNYHNCGPDHTIAAEYVSAEDVLALVHLCAAAAASEPCADPFSAMRERLEARLGEYLRYL